MTEKWLPSFLLGHLNCGMQGRAHAMQVLDSELAARRVSENAQHGEALQRGHAAVLRYRNVHSI